MSSSSVAVLVQVAATFVWLGMVVAISLLEAPLKFRAPGITLALGLGIGRLVFRALNWAEAALATLATIALIIEPRGVAPVTLLTGLWAILLVQMLAIRPRLDARAQRIIDGAPPPPARVHLAYIGLEGVKVIALAVLGTVLVLG